MKRFNTTGTCYPDQHYMVDVTQRLQVIRQMIGRGDYFCITRGRQYGKTTTLNALVERYSDEYSFFFISFEGLGDAAFRTEETLAYTFVSLLNFQMEMSVQTSGFSLDIKHLVKQALEQYSGEMPTVDLSMLISRICSLNPKPIVLIIDEVDQAGNYDSFVKFLGLLRNKYLARKQYPTFLSVILAGVYDVRNLKLKIRSEEDHQYNSPWNIAVPFDVDMSLSKEGIAGMLSDYAQDHGIAMDVEYLAQLLYDYTGGYPFLVSRLCQIMDDSALSWDKTGFLKAVNVLQNEQNTLFDDLVKKIQQFPELRKLFVDILFAGIKRSFTAYDRYMQLAEMFCFVRNDNGTAVIANRILETFLYNLFLAEEKNSALYSTGASEKSQFIVDGKLNMRHLLERFVEHYNEIYADRDSQFLERNGRQLFLLYLRPIINGVGNYYIEAQTRNETRTDVIVDYMGQQYVLEMKIWHGNAYNEKGEKQLAEYLEYFHLDKGYLVSFCFNQSKQTGVTDRLIEGKQIIEAIV